MAPPHVDLKRSLSIDGKKLNQDSLEREDPDARKGNKQEPKFYRPISMLPAIARLRENMSLEDRDT